MKKMLLGLTAVFALTAAAPAFAGDAAKEEKPAAEKPAKKAKGKKGGEEKPAEGADAAKK